MNNLETKVSDFAQAHPMMGVYVIENSVNGHKYIGSSVDCFRRFGRHMNAAIHGDLSSPIFYRAVNKYGVETFTHKIVEKVDDIFFLRAREQCWINREKPEYNISLNAWCSYPENISEVRSLGAKKAWARPDYREKAIKVRQGKTSNKGYKCTLEQIENRRKSGKQAFKGKKHTAESKYKMSISQKSLYENGYKNPITGPRPEKVKEKMRIASTKRWYNNEWLENFVRLHNRLPYD